MKYHLKYNAPVVLTFALISGAVLLISELTGYRFINQWFVTGRGALTSLKTYITMFTYVLGHASVQHYMNNIIMFLLVGPGIEEKYGSRNTLLIILFTAFLTALVNMIFTRNGLIGCSGIVFCFIILSSMTSFNKGEIPLTMIVVMIMYLGQEVYNGLFSQDNVSQLAHILGGLAGAVFGFVLPRDSKYQRYS